jgi:neutral ceramidase
MKKVLIVVGVIILLLIIAFFMITGTVDHTPYFKDSYYALTLSRLDSVQKKMVPVYGALQAGFARVNITPSINADKDDSQRGAFKVMPLAGYGDRHGRPAEGTHDSLFIKAIALKVDAHLIILLASDLLIMPPEVSDSVGAQLQKETDLKRSQLFFSATHTHSSVGAWATGFVGSEFAGEENPAVRRWLTEQIKQCILKARADLKPARIASATFAAPANVRNRLVGNQGKVNDLFSFLAIDQSGGKKGIIGAYAAHATTLGASNLLFSADYPGYWQRKLEKNGIDIALFFAGTVGSHGPVGEGNGFERAQNIGETLADSVRKHIKTLTWKQEIEFNYLSCLVRLPEFHVRVSLERHLCTALSKQLLPLADDVWIQTARIGDMVWVTTPCDFSGEFAIDLQNELFRKGYKLAISSFNGAYVGYVIPRKYFYLKKYESFTMAWFGPNLGDYFVDIIDRITSAVSK